MKVVCIKKYRSQGLQYELTYGKVYETVPGTATRNVTVPGTSTRIPSIDNYNYLIINDRGCKEYYSKDKFITLEEWRKRQLNELGI